MKVHMKNAQIKRDKTRCINQLQFVNIICKMIQTNYKNGKLIIVSLNTDCIFYDVKELF